MRLIKRLIRFVVIIAVLCLALLYFRPQIKDLLVNRGLLPESIVDIPTYNPGTINALAKDGIISINYNDDLSFFTVVVDDTVDEQAMISLSGKLFAIYKAYSSVVNTNQISSIEFYSSTTGQRIRTFTTENFASNVTGDALEYIGDTISSEFDTLASNVREN